VREAFRFRTLTHTPPATEARHRGGTYYSLVFDALAPAHRRAEAFALLRTANSVGIIRSGSEAAVRCANRRWRAAARFAPSGG
jgi:hypothetical protein